MPWPAVQSSWTGLCFPRATRWILQPVTVFCKQIWAPKIPPKGKNSRMSAGVKNISLDDFKWDKKNSRSWWPSWQGCRDGPRSFPIAAWGAATPAHQKKEWESWDCKKWKMRGDKSSGSMTRETLRKHLVLLGSISGSRSWKTYPKCGFGGRSRARAGLRHSWMPCRARGVQLWDPELLPGQPAVTHARSSSRWCRTAQSICSCRRNSWMSQLGTVSRVQS